MLKQDAIYQLVNDKVGLKEDAKYRKLFDPDDIFGVSLHPLALRHFKRFVAVLYHLIAVEKFDFDLIVGAGDSGIWLTKIAEMIYERLNLEKPEVLALPIVRFKFTYLKYEGQPLELFDNSVLIPEAEKSLKGLKKLKNILYLDDEIKNGVTAREAVRVILKAVSRDKIAENVNVIIVAEDQGFDPSDFLEGVTASIYPFAKKVPGIYGVINYIVPWEIEKQINTLFSEGEAGSKVRINMLLDLPSKDKELMESLYIPKPVFIYDYNKKAEKEIPDFKKLQSEFRECLSKWVDEAFGEYLNSNY